MGVEGQSEESFVGVSVGCDSVIGLGDARGRFAVSLEVGEFNVWVLDGSLGGDRVGGTD